MWADKHESCDIVNEDLSGISIRKELCMRKMTYVTAFTLAVILGVGLAAVVAEQAEAKPSDCLLTIEPYLVCEDSPRCKGAGEQLCYECQGVDVYGEPCLCTRVGCMVP